VGFILFWALVNKTNSLKKSNFTQIKINIKKQLKKQDLKKMILRAVKLCKNFYPLPYAFTLK